MESKDVEREISRYNARLGDFGELPYLAPKILGGYVRTEIFKRQIYDRVLLCLKIYSQKRPRNATPFQNFKKNRVLEWSHAILRTCLTKKTLK